MKEIFGRFVVSSTDRVALKSIADVINTNLNANLKFEEHSHCTVVYIKNSEQKNRLLINNIINLFPNDNCKESATVLRFNKFGKALVLEIEFHEAQQRFKEYAIEGYNHSFPQYRPHVTIFQDFPFELSDIPDIYKDYVINNLEQINFNYYKIEEQDEYKG